MLRTVVLRHTEGDGASHFDWMVEHPGLTDDRRLLSWRTWVRPDRSPSFLGEQIGHHRAVYLEYEGDLGAGRGRVERLATGVVRWERWSGESVAFEVVWEDGRKCRFEGQNRAEGGWWFEGSAESPST